MSSLAPIVDAVNWPIVDLPAIIAEACHGRMFILIDDVTRTGEGVLVVPADATASEHICVMAREARGLVCLGLTAMHALSLGLSLQPRRGERRLDTMFAVSIEARAGVSTGISASDRAVTIRTAMDRATTPDCLASPGHVFPVVADAGGILAQPGFCEASLEVMLWAGRRPGATICSVLNDDGTMASEEELVDMSWRLGLRIGRISQVLRARALEDCRVRRVSDETIALTVGDRWSLMRFESNLIKGPRWVIAKGDAAEVEPESFRLRSLSVPTDAALLRPTELHVRAAAATLSGVEAGAVVLEPTFTPEGSPWQGPVHRAIDDAFSRHVLADLGVHLRGSVSRGEADLDAPGVQSAIATG